MDAFGYLSVLLSIILGLAVTQILTGVRGLILRRARVRTYWVPIAWSLITLLVLTQSWWAMFGLRGHAVWTFAEFATVLLHTVCLYLLAALVLPDFGDEPVDLRAHYFAHRGWFFTFIVLATVASLAKSVVLSGALPERRDLAFHGVYALVGLAALATARPRVHELLTLAMAGVFGAYVALLFTTLG